MAKNKNSQVKLVLTQLITDIFEKNKNIALNHKQVASKLNLTDGASANTILEILVEETEKAIACGMNDYVTKPIVKEILLKKIENWLKLKNETSI